MSAIVSLLRVMTYRDAEAITLEAGKVPALRRKGQIEALAMPALDAHMLEEIGCFSIVFEKIPANLATEVSTDLKIPTIGIGAGHGTDVQELVLHDMLGINKEFHPRYLRRYLKLFHDIKAATEHYIKDVYSRYFPNEKEQY